MHLKDLKRKTPAELVAMAEELGVEGASTMRRQDQRFPFLEISYPDGEQPVGRLLVWTEAEAAPQPWREQSHAANGLRRRAPQHQDDDRV